MWFARPMFKAPIKTITAYAYPNAESTGFAYSLDSPGTQNDGFEIVPLWLDTANGMTGPSSDFPTCIKQGDDPSKPQKVKLSYVLLDGIFGNQKQLIWIQCLE